jgi:integrase/recombinase XerC
MDVITRFEKHLQTQDYSPVSIRGYRGDIRHFSHWYERHTEQEFSLARIGVWDIQAYRQSMLASDLKPNTINRRLAALASFGGWAVQSGHLSQNPALHIRNLDSVSLAPKWLDKKQRAAFTRAAKDDLAVAKKRYPRLWLMRLRDAAMVITLINTGLRVHELCQLRLGNLEISARKGHVTVTGKGFKQRTIPLNKPAREIVMQWVDVHPDESLGVLFVNQRGDIVKARSVQRAVRRITEAAGLDIDVTPHTLRHTFAKSLIDEGVSLEKVAKLLGHSNLNTTRVYTTPSEKDLEDAVKKLD